MRLSETRVVASIIKRMPPFLTLLQGIKHINVIQKVDSLVYTQWQTGIKMLDKKQQILMFVRLIIFKIVLYWR